MTIQNDGNVGIGTTGPEAVLDVQSSNPIIMIRAKATGVGKNAVIRADRYDNNAAAALHFGTVGIIPAQWGIGTRSDQGDNLVIDSAGATSTVRMLINRSNGNVGIGTTSPAAKLDVAGGIKSTMWAVSKPIAYAGSAYPRSGTFTSNGGTLMIFASAGAYAAAAGTMQVDVKLDTVVKASLKAYTNEASSHKMLCSDPIVLTGIGAGSHTVELVLVAGSSDVNDYSQVTVLELPF